MVGGGGQISDIRDAVTFSVAEAPWRLDATSSQLLLLLLLLLLSCSLRQQ